MVASGEKGTVDVTVDNIHLAKVILLGDPVKYKQDDVEWLYFTFTVLPPYKIPEHFDQDTGMQFFDEVKHKRNLLGSYRMPGFWFIDEIELLLK